MNDKKLSFREELRLQRWDDHRYYHQSRINQSLHMFSACCFMTTYALLFVNVSASVFLGWIVAMSSRQIGHFFFEPKSYDVVNGATHEHKEEIKVGYNLFRKRILEGLWAISPVVLYFNPTLFGIFEEYRDWNEFLYNLSVMWFVLAVGALIFRTVQLFIIYNVQTGLVWATKILTDPFTDFKTYLKSPLYLMKGQLIDPMEHVHHSVGDDQQEPEPLTQG
jgi:hypothetical protein